MRLILGGAEARRHGIRIDSCPCCPPGERSPSARETRTGVRCSVASVRNGSRDTRFGAIRRIAARCLLHSAPRRTQYDERKAVDSNPHSSRTPRCNRHWYGCGRGVKRSIVVILAVILPWAPECLAQPASVQLGWDAVRTVQEHGEFREGVKIRLKSGKRLQGSLAGMDASGLGLRRKGVNTRVRREEIHLIRFFPRKARTKKHRILAAFGGVPIGILAGLGVVALCCDVDRGASLAAFHLTWAGVQVLLYTIGAKADRGRLDVVIQDSG